MGKLIICALVAVVHVIMSDFIENEHLSSQQYINFIILYYVVIAGWEK